jgi:Dam-replacing family
VKATGDTGEQYIVDYAPCPACGKKLMRLPPNYPLFDVQCEGCTFRCQVKAAASRPQNQIFGAGWNVFYASLKGGHLVPLLIYVANLGNEAAEHFRQILGRIERLAWHPT